MSDDTMHPISDWIARAQADERSRIREVVEPLCDVLEEILGALRRDAPGTRLNNQKYDALGVKAYRALATARERMGKP